MEKKKVLIIIPDRFEKPTGGMGGNSLPIFKILSKEYDFYVAGNPLEDTKVPECIKGYHEVYLPFTETKFGPLNTLIAQTPYFTAAATFPKPDVVLAFDWSIYQAASETADFFKVPLIARMCMSPILLAREGYTFGLNLNNPTERAIHNSLCEMDIRGLKKANRIVHVSRGYEKQYEKFMSFKDKSALVINGIDLEKWQKPNLAKFKFPGTGKKKVIFLGRPTVMKGVLDICNAKIPDEIDLIFIGPKKMAEGNCIKMIEEKVKSEKNIYFIDGLYGEDKIRALRSADAMIIPSHHEAFGGVGLEGLAAGCIVLSSRVGGLSDYLNDENSIYCGTTSNEIEKALEKFIKLGDEECNKMKELGFQTCKKLTIESAADQLRVVFEEVLQ